MAPRASGRAGGGALGSVGATGRSFGALLVALLIFTLGNSTDAFLVLRATQLGVPVALIPILWAMLHVVKSSASTPGGALSDRVGRKPTIVAGWLLYALVYAGFAHARVTWHVWVLFAVYGVFSGSPRDPRRRSSRISWAMAHAARPSGGITSPIGLAALPASLLFGHVWDRHGAPAAFLMGAGLALAAACWLLVAVRVPVPPPTPRQA